MTLDAGPVRPDLDLDPDFDLDMFRRVLAAAEIARSRQLAALPASPGDMVAVLHRESVQRLLADIQAAIERLATGRFGRCTSCQEQVPLERLELRPWASTCIGCGKR